MTQSPAPTTLSNLNLLVTNVEVSQRFYEQALGLTLDVRRSAPPAMLILQTASGCSLSLKDAQTEAAEKRAGPGDIELGFETQDLDTVHAALQTFGVMVTEIQEQGFGRTFDARDPDGHHLVIYTLHPENRP
ncbi:VOC family protein [Deinococcus ruber]|uniref:VOC domain-containing protein n=1 Tax=Deinococcus ruber TaxID=1848197 RepID=A0A918CBN4_9DEIO|nr:VOC family protein [Deinococcus ruber]GGR15636.1 hypothetical protein GCM10008957_30470 [Deinococcus ruber]